MDLWAACQAVILGILEGLTEFLPVSSTGHLIVAGDLLKFNGESATAFKIIIQLGAIVAVMWDCRPRIFGVLKGLPQKDRQSWRFTINLLIAFLPAVFFGLLLGNFIEHWLFNPITVAAALVVGGGIILWAEKRKHQVHAETIDDMGWQLALKVGLAQCLAMFPGTSRSGATIIGGMLLGLSRKAATEFSFYLAMPTMVAATAYSLVKHWDVLHGSDVPILLLGFMVTFVVAMLTVRALMRFVGRHSYAVFAWYRIAFGLLILATWLFGWVDWSSARG